MKHWKESAAIFARLDVLLAEGQTAELVTLVRAEGSSYRRPGARVLFEPSGAMIGNVSGGCLEDDLRAHAESVRAESATEAGGVGRPRIITYDTSDESSWGLGLGCKGRVDLLVQTISPVHAQAIATIRDALEADAPFEIYLNADGSFANHRSPQTLLVDRFTPPPTLLICGSGEDARPLCRLAADVGFRVEIADPRPAYCTRARFPEARRLHVARPEAAGISLAGITCAMVMTHHLDRDRAWMGRLLACGDELRYLGLLGPKPRRDQILRELTDGEDDELDPRIHAPAGLDVGGEGAEMIALSVVTEMLALIHHRDARSLRNRRGSIHGNKVERGHAAGNGSRSVTVNGGRKGVDAVSA